MNDRSPAKLGDILPRVMSLMGLDGKIEEARLVRAWAEIVGPVVAARSRAREIRDGVLFVGVESGVWMQELWYHREEILGRIRKAYPRVAVKQIRLEVEREKP